MKYLLIFIFLILSFNSTMAQIISQEINNIKIMDDWSKFYTQHDLEGTFVVSKLGVDTLYIYNQKRANQQFLPASTFKILNSLIALESNAIENEDEIIKWDGKKRFYDKWNQDQNLKIAIKYSCVWFYQELARRVGEQKMQFYLDTANYGNSKIGADIDKFWLEGELRISAIEQINFLKGFLNNKFPFSDHNYDVVKNILLIDSTDTYKLYAKTGWTSRVVKEIGWYVGFVENNSGTFVFAMNIDINDNEHSKLREGISRDILKSCGIIK